MGEQKHQQQQKHLRHRIQKETKKNFNPLRQPNKHPTKRAVSPTVNDVKLMFFLTHIYIYIFLYNQVHVFVLFVLVALTHLTSRSHLTDSLTYLQLPGAKARSPFFRTGRVQYPGQLAHSRRYRLHHYRRSPLYGHSSCRCCFSLSCAHPRPHCPQAARSVPQAHTCLGFMGEEPVWALLASSLSGFSEVSS